MLSVVSPLTASEEQLVTEVVDCGFQVHVESRAGLQGNHLSQSAYRLEFDSRGLKFECEKAIDGLLQELDDPGPAIRPVWLADSFLSRSRRYRDSPPLHRGKCFHI